MMSTGCAILAIIMVSFCFLANAVEYKRNDAGLTLLPTDIPANVTSIDLAKNQIGVLDQGALSSYTSLEEFDARSNVISKISPTAFQGTVLEILNLRMNSLEDFPDVCAIGATLKELNLQLNQINIIANFTTKALFACLKALEDLNLANNLLTVIPPVDHMPNLSLLTTLRLGANAISEPCPPEFFRNMSGLTYAALKGFFVSTPDFSQLPAKNLGFLSLEQGNFSSLPHAAAMSSLNIDALFMTEKGQILSDAAPYIGHSLRTLRCAFCGVVPVTLPYFPHLERYDHGWHGEVMPFPDIRAVNQTLKKLEFGGGGLEYDLGWIEEVLRPMTSLKVIIFRNNRLPGLPDLTQILPKMTSLQFSGNHPVRCDCSMKWMKRLEENPTSSVTVDSSGLTCASPLRMNGRAWSSLTSDDLTCASPLCSEVNQTFPSCVRSPDAGLGERRCRRAVSCTPETAGSALLQDVPAGEVEDCLLRCLVDGCGSFYYRETSGTAGTGGRCVTHSGTQPATILGLSGFYLIV